MRERSIRPTVVLLGLASLLNDAASEIIYPLLPVYLSASLGAGPFAIGMIEAFADALASVLKWFAGWWSDRVPKRKPFVVAGYAIATLARWLIAIAASWAQVLGARLLDRTGKGIRTAPRDALIGDVTAPEHRGRAFGFHRAMDHAGAVIGPIAAFVMISVLAFDLHTVFLVAIIPGLVGTLVLLFFLKETPRATDNRSKEAMTPLPTEFRKPMRAIGMFCLANSSDAFLLLHAHLVGIETRWLPLLWAAHHVVKTSLSTAGGELSDKFPRGTVLAVGWAGYSLIYFLFPLATSVAGFAIMFVVYAMPFALIEGTERAWITDFVPADAKGRAFGIFHLVQGVGTLSGTAVFGLYYQHISTMGAFHLAGGIAAVAAVMALLVEPPVRER